MRAESGSAGVPTPALPRDLRTRTTASVPLPRSAARGGPGDFRGVVAWPLEDASGYVPGAGSLVPAAATGAFDGKVPFGWGVIATSRRLDRFRRSLRRCGVPMTATHKSPSARPCGFIAKGARIKRALVPPAKGGIPCPSRRPPKSRGAGPWVWPDGGPAGRRDEQHQRRDDGADAARATPIATSRFRHHGSGGAGPWAQKP